MHNKNNTSYRQIKEKKGIPSGAIAEVKTTI